MALPAYPNALSIDAIDTELGSPSGGGDHSFRNQSSIASKSIPDSFSEFHSYSHATIPNAPTNVAGVHGGSGDNDHIYVTFTDNSGDEDYFDIEASINSTSSYSSIGINPANDTTKTHIINCLTTDFVVYRVKSRNSAGSSAWAYSTKVFANFC
jgi:hypothetical protein